ncbi:PEP-CTERM sorting domain-containing protein [Microcoleus sp. B9-D4]|uniref:PEP-CTERM sorting domain-containing protein n=1 Tax=Microcoleus sp. B9-D4 TaxID=2818711 RepID=UPI002FCF9769
MKFNLNLVKSILAVAGIAAVSGVSAAPASAISLAPTSFSFSNITGGATVGDNGVNDFSFTVAQNGLNNVLFNIFNKTQSNDGRFIGGVYFDTGSNTNLLSALAINVRNTGKVEFDNKGGSNLPQSGNLRDWSTDFFATTKGAASNGVQKNEALGLSFRGDYSKVVSELNKGTLRLGLHVQTINGGSDSFVSSTSNTQATPEPLTMLAAGAAVGFGTMFKKQRAQAQKAE